MTERLIPLPFNHEEWILKLFHVFPPDFTLTERQYLVYWPLVDGFWTHRQTQKHIHKRSCTHYYDCRIGKQRVSSKAESIVSENPSGKTRITSFYASNNCPMKIRVVESLLDNGTPKTFTISRVKSSKESVHNHTIDVSWQRKRSSFLINIIQDELAKGYTPSQVKDRLKGTGRAGGYERLETIGGAFMKRKDCANLSQKLRNGILDIRKIAPGTSFNEDWDLACIFLHQQQYYHHTLSVVNAKGSTTKGLVFAYPARLKILSKRGFLTVFDSSHKLNVHNFNLFTFMCRDEHGIWVPGAHCLVEHENSDILAEALKQIYQWSNKTWKVQYPLTDNSAIEKLAIQKAFESEAFVKKHLLCTVHSERTLNRRFKSLHDKPSYTFLRHAMRCFTEEECIELCQKAMEVASSSEQRKYIAEYWLETREEWAMFARQHNQLLLQVTSSNACEAWHSRLKNGAGKKKGETATHGIFGCIRTIHDCAHDIDNNITAARIQSKSKYASLTKKYPSLSLFPYAVQLLLATEEKKVAIRLEQFMPVPVREREVQKDNISIGGLFICNCLFSRRYQLPCQHIFHIDQAISPPETPGYILSSEMWFRYLERFGTGGLESYESCYSGVEEDVDSLSASSSNMLAYSNRTYRVLKLAEIHEQLRSLFYQLEEIDTEQSSKFLSTVENHLHNLTNNSNFPLAHQKSTPHPYISDPNIQHPIQNLNTPSLIVFLPSICTLCYLSFNSNWLAYIAGSRTGR